jgi:glucose-6-phosphate 1-dehydrogenase
MSKSLEPAVIVIFGITGDLSQRYLLPALYHLFKEELIHKDTKIVGLSRQQLGAEDVYNNLQSDSGTDASVITAMHSKTKMLKLASGSTEDYSKLLEVLNELEAKDGVCMNRIYYLSVPPKLFKETVANLGKADLNKSCPHSAASTRILVEKPFGNDYASAKELVNDVGAVFKEEQIFRVDHYLAKETVQNILTFRSENPIFKAIWNKDQIQSIDIIGSEKIGIEGRVNFYEGVGAMRDLIQSHLLQLLAVVTMDLPEDLSDTASIHQARQTLLESIQPAEPERAIRGQYKGYKSEVGSQESNTETYAELNLRIESEALSDVPIRIISGKGLAEKKTEISIKFGENNSKATNTLIFRIQPNEGIHIELRVKEPNLERVIADANMDFSYSEAFKIDTSHPTAYERVLADAFKGDRTLFATSDEVLASWRVIEPVIEAWKDNDDDLISYEMGADKLI